MKKLFLSIATIPLFSLLLLGCNSGHQTNDNATNNKGDTSNVNNLSVAPPNNSDSNSLQILFPQGGEKLVKGKTYTFKWTGGDSTLTIFLIDSSLESKGVSVSLADRIYGIANEGTYQYTVPDRLKEGTYKIRIGKEADGYFKIVAKDTAR